MFTMLKEECDNPQQAVEEIREQFFSEDTDVYRPEVRQKMGSLWGYYVTKDWFIHFDIKSDIIKLDRIAGVYYAWNVLKTDAGKFGSYNMHMVLESGKTITYSDLKLEEIQKVQQIIHEKNPYTYLLGDMTDRYVVSSENAQPLNIQDESTIVQAYHDKKNRQ